MGLALCCCFTGVTDEKLDEYEVILGDRDDRLGQGLYDYDRLHACCEEAIVSYNLNRPQLFKLEFVDRYALLHHVTDKVH